MNTSALRIAGILGLLYSATLSGQGSGPGDRQVTDPHSIDSPANLKARPVPIDDLYFTRSIYSASWSPDGKEILFTTDMSGRSNLWKVNSAGGWPVQLTQSDERQTSGTWSPDGMWIVFQQDVSGNELWDVFAVPGDGGEVINLTNTPDVREESPRWSPSGNSIALNIKPKEGTSYDIGILDWATRRVTNLTRETSPAHSWGSVAWSPDGRTVYASRYDISFTDADVYAVDVASRKVTNLTPHQGKVLNFASSLSPDGKTLLVTSSERGGFQNVALLDVATGRRTWVTDTQWEASAGDFSPNGKLFSYILNSDGLTSAYLVDSTSLKSEQVPLGTGVNGLPAYPNSFSPSGDRLLVSHESSAQPADFWIYDIATHRAMRLTQSAVASLSSAAMPESRLVHYRTFDGKIISALM